MATYAVGDIQGCFSTLEALLARIEFDRRQDRLWLVGDLVNRGPASLEVLRWAAGLDASLTCVLGNHDLHLLARAEGSAEPKRRDTLDAVLAAPDRDDLLGWLRARPLLHVEDGVVLVHAGLWPQWSVQDAQSAARELETALRTGPIAAVPRGTEPLAWDPKAPLPQRLRATREALTTLRACDAGGRSCPEFSGPPADAPSGCLPWFEVAGRRSADHLIVFGHWSALGLHVTEKVLALDTGCVWGRQLTAARLDDRFVFQEPCRDELRG